MTGQNLLFASHVEEAMKIMYPFTLKKEGSLTDMLKQIGLYDYRMVDALIATGTEQDVHRLVDATAHVILRTYETLEGKHKSRISWADTKTKMMAEVKPEFAEWFMQAEHKVHILNLIDQQANYIKSSVDSVMRNVSALISTEEAFQQAKNEIETRFAELNQRVNSQEELSESEKADLLAKMEEGLAQSLHFLAVKYAEKPIHILYYRTGSRVAVKVNLNKNGYTYTVGRKREIRWNKGEDREMFPLVVSVSYIEEFLYQNGVRDVDILVDAESVDQYYSFSDRVSANLTPSFIDTWYNHDCPELKRHTPNKHRGTTMLGMPICHFTNVLVESSWSADYIDEDMTVEEANALTKSYGHTRISREIRTMLKARDMKEAGKTEELETFVNEFDARVQAVIDEHAPEILQALVVQFPQRIKMATGTDGAEFSMNDDFGFDCGFLNVQAIEPEYTEKRGILRNIKSISPWMDLRMPYNSQSVTVLKAQFDIAKEIVYKKIGITLVGHTVLD